jgi:hypothetical protein
VAEFWHPTGPGWPRGQESPQVKRPRDGGLLRSGVQTTAQRHQVRGGT